MERGSLGDFLVRHYHAFLLVGGLVILVCLVALIGVGVSQIRPPRTFLEISVVPGGANILINGQNYHNGVYEMEPGLYTANITANGFNSMEPSVVVNEGETSKLSVVLDNKNEGMDYYLKDQGDLDILGSMDDERAKAFIESYNEQISIRNYFPIDASYATDRGVNYSQTISDGSYESECDRAFCLLVKGYGEPNVETIEKRLDDLGYNIDDYQIIYDFRN